jgi:hypothetical protein
MFASHGQNKPVFVLMKCVWLEVGESSPEIEWWNMLREQLLAGAKFLSICDPNQTQGRCKI